MRLIVIPATQDVYKQAMHEGLFDVFVDAGGAVSTPTCGPCLGGYMGILAAGERAISTTNRNFVGRMGDRTSEVYLAGPAVAAASAVAGRIAGPGGGAVMAKLRGRVFRYGKDVNTDLIIPARYLNIIDVQEQAKHSMEDIDRSSSRKCGRATSSWPRRTSAAAPRARRRR